MLGLHVTCHWAQGCDSCIFAAVLYLFRFPIMRIQDLQLIELNNLSRVFTPESQITANRENPNLESLLNCLAKTKKWHRGLSGMYRARLGMSLLKF